jgi:hypothetical protein
MKKKVKGSKPETYTGKQVVKAHARAAAGLAVGMNLTTLPGEVLEAFGDLLHDHMLSMMHLLENETEADQFAEGG